MSPTTPTISHRVRSLRRVGNASIRLPIASRGLVPGQSMRISASLTTATGVPSGASVRAMSRPTMDGMRIVAKYPSLVSRRFASAPARLG
jgi:hypothetical protein